LFDPAHPYYYNSTPELYDALQQNTLSDFYKSAYSAEVCKIAVTGDTQGLAPLLNKYLGQLFMDTHATVAPKIIDTIYNKEYPKPIYQQINPQAPSSQACIRIGKACMDKKHPDFAGFYILNVLLGGYFGSRLMQNLREDKGYTYGVYSSIDEMRLAAYYCIETEVIAEAAEDAVLQIHTEMERLQTDLVKSKELETLKSYLMGAYLNHLDGFFNLSNIWSDCVRAGVNLSYIETLVQTTQDIQPKTLRTLAQAYFQKADLQQVIIQ
jgi:zinc protease